MPDHDFRRRVLPFAIELLEGEPNGEIAGGQNIGPAQIKNQQHVDRPRADPAHLREAGDKLGVAEFARLLQGRHDPFPAFEREIAQRRQLARRETGPAQGRVGRGDKRFRGRAACPL